MTLFRMEVKQNCEIFLKVDERSHSRRCYYRARPLLCETGRRLQSAGCVPVLSPGLGPANRAGSVSSSQGGRHSVRLH
ncbi:hypothetical protein [Pseudomonas phage BL1]|nr:hypothetical protein [Pseudomonas phage BL1]